MKTQTANKKSNFILTLLIGIATLSGACASTDPVKIELPVYPPAPETARFYFERTVATSAATDIPGGEDKLKALLTGSTDAGALGFGKPFDIAVHRGRLFVTDSARRLIHVLDFMENKSFQFGDRDDGGDVDKPLGIAADRNGHIYVCDATKKSIMVFNRDGDFIKHIGTRENFDRPAGVDVSPDGTQLFVVDTGGVDSRKHRIVVFDVESGEHVKDLSMRGTGEGELNLPRDVKLGPDGLLYVTDGGNFRVQVFDQEGEYVRAWGKPGKRFGQFSRPKGISIDPQGNIYAVDAAFGNFQIFTPEGRLLLFVGDRSTTQEPGKFMLPAGIDVDEDGRVYVVGQYFRKVDVFRPAYIGEDEGYFVGNPISPERAAQIREEFIVIEEEEEEEEASEAAEEAAEQAPAAEALEAETEEAPTP